MIFPPRFVCSAIFLPKQTVKKDVFLFHTCGSENVFVLLLRKFIDLFAKTITWYHVYVKKKFLIILFDVNLVPCYIFLKNNVTIQNPIRKTASARLF